MMGNTYHQITKKSEKEWKKQVKLFENFIFSKNYIIRLINKNQWAGVILLLERSYTPDDLKKFQNKSCIMLPSKQPGLMVIRKIDKTRAYQKTMCVRNWKVIKLTN